MHAYVCTHTDIRMSRWVILGISLTFSSTHSSPRPQLLPRTTASRKLCYLAGPLKPMLTAPVKQRPPK